MIYRLFLLYIFFFEGMGQKFCLIKLKFPGRPHVRIPHMSARVIE